MTIQLLQISCSRQLTITIVLGLATESDYGLANVAIDDYVIVHDTE